METTCLRTMRLVLAFLLSAGGVLPALAQEGANYVTIHGTVRDGQSGRLLDYVTVSVAGTGVGTVTNADGAFSIKVNKDLKAKTLEFSHVGYYTQKFSIQEGDVQEAAMVLKPLISTLQEIVVQGVSAHDLVRNAIDKIAENNSPTANLLTGFYRETIKKRRNYINISEAIVNVYKTSYEEHITRDRVQVYKGRQLLSPKRGDTIIVKLQGGPNLSVYLDLVKNRESVLDPESLQDYHFKIETHTIIDERPHYVVSFEPQVVLPYPLMYGRLYIDEQNLTFSRVEFSLSMDDRNKVTQTILRKKPFHLRFKPEEINYLVTYKQQNGRSYLSYIRSEINFKCDWRRRLFSTGYSVVSEMVVTDRREGDIANIPSKLAFRNRNSLADEVSRFYDEDFWEDYNIIAPTESLEAAVNKLRKSIK